MYGLFIFPSPKSICPVVSVLGTGAQIELRSIVNKSLVCKILFISDWCCAFNTIAEPILQNNRRIRHELWFEDIIMIEQAIAALTSNVNTHADDTTKASAAAVDEKGQFISETKL